MKDYSTWQSEIENQIEILKSRGRHTYFSISNEMTRYTANSLKTYFEKDCGYFVEIKTCGCGKNKWDIVIEWRLP